MKLIFKYLKPYLITVVAVVLLTFIQVQTELALPDYMSDIVTNGIQYSGVNDKVPVILSEEDFNTIVLFSDNTEVINNSYKRIEKGTRAIVKNQEIEFNTSVYLLEGESNAELEEAIQLPIVYSYLAKQSKLDTSKENISNIKEQLEETVLESSDSYSSIVMLYCQDVYKNIGINTNTIQTNYVVYVGLEMIGISLIGVLVQIISTYLSTKVAAKIGAKMRRDVFEKVESFSSAEFSKFSTASLITRTSNDITKLQTLILMMMRMMLMSPMMGITAVVKVSKYPQVSWVLLVAIAIIVVAFILVLLLVVPKFEIIQKLTDGVNHIMREFLDGMLPIRAFNAQEKEEEKFDQTNTSLYKIDRFVSRITASMIPLITLIMNGLTIAIVWVASKQIDMDVMSVGNMLAFLQYAMHVVISFMLVAAMFFIVPRALVSAKRVQEVLKTELTINDKDNPENLPLENGDLVFENVSFRYPGAEEQVLENISFVAKPKETVAFIGSTGSGKSTIIKLIPRLFDVTEGRILYCGKDIRDVKQKELRDKIGYATQKAILFTGDLESNISFGREVSEEEINTAIDIAQAREIVNDSELGIKQEITQGGTNVSGGQKQRISIARVLAKQKNIYIFDDSFSALDYATDKKLREELNELIKKTNSTVLIVAQRIATIKNADKIVVLDSGKIVGIGTHKELLNTCDVYKEIANSQLTKEELENA